jgi:hypothetical protein
MRPAIQLLLCCLFLAGCAEDGAEVATKAVDFSKPVPTHSFFVAGGPLEGIIMYPVPLAGKHTVEGTYRQSNSRNDLSVAECSLKEPPDDRVIIQISDERDRGVNASFFVHGLANGCTGATAASRVDIMRAEKGLASTWELGLTHSRTVDDAYPALAKDPATTADVDRNALFMNSVLKKCQPHGMMTAKLETRPPRP